MSEIDHQIRVRERFGLRADRAWVERIAEHDIDRDALMTLGIPLTRDEIDDMRARGDRAFAITTAVDAAQLASSAGCWIDQAAGGVTHVLLARPDATERAVAERIVGKHGGVVELVEHSTAELEQVVARVVETAEHDPEFGPAMAGWGISVSVNAVGLLIRDADATIPPAVRDAVAAGTVVIEYGDVRDE